ncbi:MAG: glycosyltransferase family 1 protein [Chlamydiae bacterium]|nr:glycosyltransferase family 1 protein [Chlamydiota bacterium]
MKTLCIDLRMYDASGIGVYLRNIVQRLAGCDTFRIRGIVSPRSLQQILELPSIEIVISTAPIYSIQEQIDIPLKVGACDVFWTPHFNAPVVRLQAKKRVVTIHDVFHLAYGDVLPWYKRIYAKQVICRAVQLADALITVSDFSKSEIQRYTGVHADKVHPILNGVDTAFFQPSSVRQYVGADIGRYSMDRPFILFVGNLKPHKNLDGLLQAYKKWIGVHGTEYHLILIGKTFENYPIIQAIQDDPIYRGQVHVFSDVTDVELCLFYLKAAVLVMPSFYEGFGLPPLEAMSCGCPTIVSKCTSLPEVCGDAAFYIDPYSVTSIYHGLCAVLHNPALRDRMIDQGYAQVVKFSWQASSQKHLQLFERLLSV